MRQLTRLCLATCIAFSTLAASAQHAQPIGTGAIDCKKEQRKIHQEGFIKIGGIEQWVTIKGDDCTNPVILFVHGGPGNPNTVFAKLPYTAWEKDFTLVQWDQRGAGRTFTRNPATAESSLSIERMAQDGTEVAAFITTYLKTKQLILFGGSWGSALSVHMAQARPDLFLAYVGTGQLVSYRENDPASYRAVLAQARADGDAKIVETVEALGPPPWSKPRNMGILIRAGRALEAKSTIAAPKSWWELGPDYATPKAQAEYEAGEDYSWIQFVGMTGKGMLSTLDLPKLGLEFKMPVFMIMGEKDLTTVPEVSKRYFDAIKAPQKAYFSLPKTGHSPNPEMIEMQIKVLKTRVLPLVARSRAAG